MASYLPNMNSGLLATVYNVLRDLAPNYPPPLPLVNFLLSLGKEKENEKQEMRLHW